MQCVVASGREGIGVGAMPQQGIGDFVEPEDGHVDERGIAEFIDGVDISSMGRQKPHAFGETLDSHEMKHGLVMNPACVEQIWMLCQKTGSSLLILNYGVDEFANERVRQVLRHRRANGLPLTCGTRESTIAPSARGAREQTPMPSGAAAG